MERLDNDPNFQTARRNGPVSRARDRSVVVNHHDMTDSRNFAIEIVSGQCPGTAPEHHAVTLQTD